MKWRLPGAPPGPILAFALVVLAFSPVVLAERILIIGDSWGWRRESSLRQVIVEDHGHSNVLVTAAPRVLTSYTLSSPGGLQQMTNWLNSYPDTTVVHLTIGANDLNITPETAGTEHADRVLSEITGNVAVIVNHLLSVKPELKIYWSSYDFFRPRPNFGTPAEMNDIYLTFNAACAELARDIGPPLTYGDIYGTLQVAFGFDGIQRSPSDPAFPIPAGDPSLPDPQWPSPAAAFPVQDAEHPNAAGWRALAEAQYVSYYGPLLERSNFQINAGLNDAWYDPATNGQGFFITVFPDIKVVFLSWFTFDVVRPDPDVGAKLGEPGHRWLTAQGPYQGNEAVLDVVMTSGGIFDSPEPAVANNAEYGSMTVRWLDCERATIEYDLEVPGLQGSMEVQRIVSDLVPHCQTLSVD